MLSLTRNGFTAAQVDAALHSSNRRLYFRYELLDDTNTFKQALTTVESCSVSYDTTQQIKRTAKFTVQDDGSINYLSDRIKPWVRVWVQNGTSGGWAEFPIGVFLLSTPPRASDSAQVVTRQVDAYDQLQILVDDKVTDRYSITAGTNYITAVSDLLQSANITQTNLTTTTLTLPTTLDWAIGTSKLKIISDLLTAINYRPLWFDANGMAIAQPYVSPSSLAPVYTYADDDASVILPAMTQTLDLFAQPNEWVLTVSQTDRASLTSIYTNTNATSPTSTVNRGRKIPKFISNVQAPDQSTLDAMAQKMAYEDSQVYEQVQFESAIMPFHEDFEVLQLTYRTLGISDKYSEIAWSFDLKAGSTMKHTVQRQVSV